MAYTSTASRAALIAVTMALSGCSGLSALTSLAGSGTNVAANTQVGKENRQAVASFETGDTAGRDIVAKEIDAGQVGTLTVRNENIPPWVFLVALLGWLAPSPGEIGRGIYKLLRGER